ncbi:MAG TPA: hypothetical protein VM760_08835 [Sphingomicrobium sp.]|jgi:hypothetical protein|nr:hypothetical protein [Sphingomicrobium sp.]
MAGVRGDIALRINLTQSGTGDIGTPKMRATVDKVLSLTEGTDATNKANILFADTRTLAASANENIDLSGALSDAFGASIAAAEIVAIYIAAESTNTNSVNVTRPASNGFIGPFLAASDGVGIKPGEYALFVSQSGWAVTAATGDLINVANSAGSTEVVFDIIIVGRTVAA